VIAGEWIRTELPRSWKVARLRDQAKVVNGYPFDSELFTADTGLPLVRIRDIASADTEVRYAGDPVPEALLKGGEILVGMDGDFNVARWRGGEALLNQRVCCIRPRPTIDGRFLYYVLPAPLSLINEFTYSTTVKHLSSFDVLKIHVPFPPLAQQRAIADYLDRETAGLDALVAAKERVLELLAEKRPALITRAVTRGLDPRAPLRDSGISWLGEIPAHWELKRAKWLFWERDQRSTTGEEVLLSLRMERGLIPHNDVSVKQTQPDELVGYKQVSTGEIVVNRMRAASGLVALARQDGLVSPDYAVFRVSPAANAEYYTHLFKTELMQAVFRSESTGLGTGSSGFLRLYSESFLSLWLPYPPPREQSAILAHIEDELAKLNAVHAATERTVALLKERRAALIAAAVTGQIDVESAA